VTGVATRPASLNGDRRRLHDIDRAEKRLECEVAAGVLEFLAGFEHEGDIDYLEDGYLKHVSSEHTEDRVVEVTATNPDRCTPEDRFWTYQDASSWSGLQP
jgi:hypothetical protein